MAEQLRLDQAHGDELRDQGVRKVYEAEDDGWKVRAEAAIYVLAKRGQSFTAEDVRAVVGDPTRPNAMGALFRLASAHGIIERVGFSKPVRPSRHASMMAVWRGVAR